MKCIPSHYLPHWIILGHLPKGRVFCFEALQHGEHDPLVELEALGSLGDSAPQGSSCLLLFRCIAFQFLLFLPGPVHHQISLRRRQFAKLRMKWPKPTVCKLSGSSLSLTYFSPWRHCLGRYVHIGLWRGNEPILALGLLRTSLISLAQPSFNFYYFYWPVARPYVQLWVIYSGEWEHELVQFMKHLKIILPKLSHKYLIGTINKNKNRSSFTWLSQMQKWMSNQAVKNRR